MVNVELFLFFYYFRYFTQCCSKFQISAYMFDRIFEAISYFKRIYYCLLCWQSHRTKVICHQLPVEMISICRESARFQCNPVYRPDRENPYNNMFFTESILVGYFVSRSLRSIIPDIMDGNMSSYERLSFLLICSEPNTAKQLNIEHIT